MLCCEAILNGERGRYALSAEVLARLGAQHEGQVPRNSKALVAIFKERGARYVSEESSLVLVQLKPGRTYFVGDTLGREWIADWHRARWASCETWEEPREFSRVVACPRNWRCPRSWIRRRRRIPPVPALEDLDASDASVASSAVDQGRRLYDGGSVDRIDARDGSRLDYTVEDSDWFTDGGADPGVNWWAYPGDMPDVRVR